MARPHQAGSGPIVLVACVKAKRRAPHPARDLYTSPLFVKCRWWAEAAGGRWFILSAKHGLVHPERTIAPYDTTLSGASKARREKWAEQVAAQLDPYITQGTEIVFLAGLAYRRPLADLLGQRGCIISAPMEGLSIGRQLAWLGAGVPAQKRQKGMKSNNVPPQPLKKPKKPKAPPVQSVQLKRHRTEVVSIDRLKPAAYNPRTITMGAKQGLRNTIERFGVVQPVVWNERTGNIVGGHQRYEVLREMGESEVEVVVVDLPEREEKMLNLALNNPAIQGTWDDTLLTALSEELGAVDELAGIYGDLQLDDLLGLGDHLLSTATFAGSSDAGEDEDEDEGEGEDWEGGEGGQAGVNDADLDTPLGVLDVTLMVTVPQPHVEELREAILGWAAAATVKVHVK